MGGVVNQFAGGDPEYLRAVQYRDAAPLTARATLHTKYGTRPIPWFEWVVDQIDWPPGSAVLEVGCGPRWFWAEAAARLPAGLRVVLVDQSPGMIDEAVRRARATGSLGTCDGQVADAQALPVRDAGFDIAIANHMLYHVPDPERAVTELARVLSPSGVLLAAANGHRNLDQLWEIQAEVFGTPARSETTTAFGMESGPPILRRGFDAVEWHDAPDELVCTDPDDVFAYLTSSPPGDTASPAQRRVLADAIDRRFDAGGGVLRVTKQTGVFVGRGPRIRPGDDAATRGPP